MFLFMKGENMTRKYEVGKLFVEGVTRYSESARFNFTQDGPVLILFYYNPTKSEIEDIRDGRIEIRFVSRSEMILVLAKFGNQPWLDASYSVHLSEPFVFQEMTETQGFGLHIILVNAATGIIIAMRMVGLSHGFSKELRKAIETQKEMPFNQITYSAKLENLYRNYTTKDLVKIADARCVLDTRRGGQNGHRTTENIPSV